MFWANEIAARWPREKECFSSPLPPCGTPRRCRSIAGEQLFA
jgi:hypothetical protein